jgi:hypothetical protein
MNARKNHILIIDDDQEITQLSNGAKCAKMKQQ